MEKELKKSSNAQLLRNDILNEYFEYTTRNFVAVNEKSQAAYERLRKMVIEPNEEEKQNKCVETVK